MKKACFFLPCFIFLLFQQFSADAIMVGLTTEQLATKATEIILGKVVELDTKWADDKSKIVTIAKVEIIEVIKGKAKSNTVSVEYEGGKIGNIGLIVSDTKIPSKGDKVLLFLKPKETNGSKTRYVIVAKAQGQYTADEGDIMSKDGFSVVSGEALIDTKLPLEVLIDKIKKALK